MSEQIRAKVIGMGSVGCHLAHSARMKNWQVSMYDRDSSAATRARELIFPSRYGKWDENIKVLSRPNAQEHFDVVFVGTPPTSHVEVALEQIVISSPQILVVEKPLAHPGENSIRKLESLALKFGVKLLVGYNQRLFKSFTQASKYLDSSLLGNLTSIVSSTRESWDGILAAHPWLSGPEDSYLGFTKRGGGALFEHSHAVNLFQYASALAGAGRVKEVSCEADWVKNKVLDYDRIVQISVKTESGLLGLIVQDLSAMPVEKSLKVYGELGFLEWQIQPQAELVKFYDRRQKLTRTNEFSKSRSDDFLVEISHIEDLILGKETNSPIGFGHGLETMRILRAALESANTGRKVFINHDD